MKKTNKKDAKFFCESCGSEVPRKSRFCPVCGKFFASVRCPKCGHTGSSDDFKGGCPECGYAVNKGGIGITSVSSSKETFGKKNKNSSEGSIPLWIYFTSLGVLIILIICLYSCL